tara:strand:+ start:2765 stop:5170 length:2406 start_codon:yes stop_codon:yes gene_type:complete
MSALLSEALPETCEAAAHWWYEFGFKVAPLNPQKKKTAVKWDGWLLQLAEDPHGTIARHWAAHPDHELCAIVDDEVLVLDADSPEAMTAVHSLEQVFDLQPRLVVQTSKGFHHYFLREAGSFAHMASYSSDKEPQKIDVRTGRTNAEGRSVIVLPPSTGKQIELNEADTLQDLTVAGQGFIDAVFRHNGQEPPRPILPSTAPEVTRITGQSEAAEVLVYVDPNSGYETWCKVLMGLHDKFAGSDTGLYVADSWSAKGSDYPGFEAIEYKWRSFTSGNGITFATVAEMARQNGADLSGIARSYDAEGNKLRSYNELMQAAKEMTEETDPDEISNLASEARRLDPVKSDQLLRAIKKHTNVGLTTLRAALAAVAGESSDDREDHLELARAVIGEVGRENLLSAGPFAYEWQARGVWRPMEERGFKQLVQRHLENKAAVTANTVNCVGDVLKTEIFVKDLEFNQGDPETVNTLAGELVLDETSGNWDLQPHDRSAYRTTQIPVHFDPAATAPRFIKFLDEIFSPDDDREQKKACLLQMMGYSLMTHCRHEKFVMLIGNGSNGKSVLLSLLEALLGSENVAGVQPSQFDRTFQRAHLHMKLANVVTEIREGEVIADAALKGIVSGEPSTVEHKFKDPFVMRPYATCWFGTNHMPHTRDFSDALFRRAVILTFNRRFDAAKGETDPMLKEKLFLELPGILNMVLAAYEQALRFGFTEPASSRRAKDEWRLEADQVAQFVDDTCSRVPSGEVQSQRLYDTFSHWANDQGIGQKVKQKSFIDRLTRLGFGRRRDSQCKYITGLEIMPR